MSRRYNNNHSPLERIVYTKVNVNGKVQLVPLELYADGSVKRARWLDKYWDVVSFSLKFFPVEIAPRDVWSVCSNKRSVSRYR